MSLEEDSFSSGEDSIELHSSSSFREKPNKEKAERESESSEDEEGSSSGESSTSTPSTSDDVPDKNVTKEETVESTTIDGNSCDEKVQTANGLETKMPDNKIAIESEKKPDLSLEFRPNLSDEEALRQGTELRRKGNLLIKLGKGLPEDIFKCYDESILRFKLILDEKSNQKKDEYVLALSEIALSLVDKATAVYELGTVRGESDTYYGLLEKAYKYLEMLPKEEMSPDNIRLQGYVSYLMAKYKMEVNNDFISSEKLLVLACEKLISAIKIAGKDEAASVQLEEVSELLTAMKKERQRSGKAVYHISGDFMVQSGFRKAWKQRFFVVDDSSVSWYKSKKLWESGPVLGKVVKTSGILMFSEIKEILTSDDDCSHVKLAPRPNMLKAAFAIHLVTSEKVVTMVAQPGLIKEEDAQKWPALLREIRRSYIVKKETKQHLSKDPTVKKMITSKMFDFDSDSDYFEKSSPLKSSLKKSASTSDVNRNLKKTVSWSEKQITHLLTTDTFPDDSKKKNGTVTIAQTIEESIPNVEHFTFSKLKDTLASMSDNDIHGIAEFLLDDLEREGQLRSIINNMVAANPKKFLLKLLNGKTIQHSEQTKLSFNPLQRAGEHIRVLKVTHQPQQTQPQESNSIPQPNHSYAAISSVEAGST